MSFEYTSGGENQLLVGFNCPIEYFDVDTGKKVRELFVGKNEIGERVNYALFLDSRRVMLSTWKSDENCTNCLVEYDYVENKIIRRSSKSSKNYLWYIMKPRNHDIIAVPSWDGFCRIFDFKDLSLVNEHRIGNCSNCYHSEFIRQKNEIITTSDGGFSVYSPERNKVDQQNNDSRYIFSHFIEQKSVLILVSRSELVQKDVKNMKLKGTKVAARSRGNLTSISGGDFYSVRAHSDGNLLSISANTYWRIIDLRMSCTSTRDNCVYEEEDRTLGEVWRQQLYDRKQHVVLGCNKGVQVRDWSGKVVRKWETKGSYSNTLSLKSDTYQLGFDALYGRLKQQMEEDLDERLNFLVERLESYQYVKIRFSGCETEVCAFSILL